MTTHPNVRVFLAGDSTVQRYPKSASPQAGWGQFIADYFIRNVDFVNHAIGGRSSRTFVEEGRLAKILQEFSAGDYLFVQMGHNDASKSKPERYTEPHSGFKRFLTEYVDGARRYGGVPVLITPVARLHYENEIFLNDFPDYCAAMRELAREHKVPLIDLMARSLSYFTSVGVKEVCEFFMVSVNDTDHTHFTEKGARRMARLVADGVKDLNLSIASYLLPFHK